MASSKCGYRPKRWPSKAHRLILRSVGCRISSEFDVYRLQKFSYRLDAKYRKEIAKLGDELKVGSW